MKDVHFFLFFYRFGLFPQVFGQVNEWPILESHKMISVLHAVACPIVFILFYGQDWQGGVFKIMKNDHFFSIISRFRLFRQVFGQVNECPIL